MKVDASDGSVVLLEAVDEDSHLEVPELDRTRVEGRREQGQPRVERDPFHPVRLGLELSRRRRGESGGSACAAE